MGIKSFLCFVLFFLSVAQAKEKRLQLKQVVILSRHGIRTPLATNLKDMSPNPWPEFKEKRGYLTAKGKVLEGYMGSFFSKWLKEEGLLPEGCPSEDTFFVYANTKQRTRASAYAFTRNAFPNCNITIHHSNSNVDPIFSPVIHNKSEIFRQNVLEEMNTIMQPLNLTTSYEVLETILDFKNSKMCEYTCDLATEENELIVVSGEKPNISGPLKIGNSAIDAFSMQYSDGFPFDEIAWGRIVFQDQRDALTNLTRSYHSIIYNTTLAAKDISKPLIKFMADIFLNNSIPKVSLLMGHDANIYTVLKTLNVIPYTLEEHYELVPVSSKIVFQKWVDTWENVELLKIHHIYQSYSQIREGSKLDLKHPPYFHLIELNGCKIIEDGFCLWEDFVDVLEKLK